LSVTLVYCDQTVGWIKMKLGAGSARPWPQCVGWRPSSRSPKGVQPPNFRPIYVVAKCMAGWIKMPLGREVGLDASNIVLDGDPAPPKKKGTQPPIFGPYVLWPNGRPCQLLLSTCCTAHGSESTLQRAASLSIKIAPSYGVSGPHLRHGSFGPP